MKPSKISWHDRIGKALDLGRFVSWRERPDFLGVLEAMHRDLATFAKARPREALGYFEVSLAGCLVKAGEMDDAGDDMGMFLDDLFRSWARCCSASGMKPAEFLRKIAHWIRADDIGFCHDLEETIIPALRSEYRSALRTSLEQRLREKPSNETPEPERNRLLFQYRSNLSTLKKLLMATNNTTALIETGERYGFTPEDCLALATPSVPAGNRRKLWNGPSAV